MTPHDLTKPGWRHHIGNAVWSSSCVADGHAIRSEEIRGVLSRLPTVTMSSLSAFSPNDRSYVAAEMTAYLAFWLSALRCPVLNRPTPECLVGPNWSSAQWIYRAGRLGLPTRRCVVSSSSELPESVCDAPTTVIVVGDDCVGATRPTLRERARRLARSSSVRLLAVYFSEDSEQGEIVDAKVMPELSSAVEDAILQLFMIGGV